MTPYICRDMLNNVETSEFIKTWQDFPILDVRSPSEFSEGHIPGAINLPLFDDSERKIVGTLYKNSGKEASVLSGLEFVGPKMTSLVKQAWQISPRRKLRIHCWRGGMRSESMAWLCNLAGFEVRVLTGGYKAYRRFIREQLGQKMPYIVLSGGTGSGKTEILKSLKEKGHQVLDLEALARHKGSAFGALGQNEQPTNEQFENDLYENWKDLNPEKPVWVEDESRSIGKVAIPDPLFENLRNSPVIELEIPVEHRIENLVNDYSFFPKEELIAGINRISRNLGGGNAKKAIQAILDNDFRTAIRIVLVYYDKTYRFNLMTREKANIQTLTSDRSDIEINTHKILHFFEKIKRI